MHTINIRVTHHRADIPTLEAIAFPDAKRAVKEISSLPSVKECVVVQTCNRMEIFAAAEDVDVAYHDIIDYVMDRSISRMKEHPHVRPDTPPEKLLEHMIDSSKRLHDVIETDFHMAALSHLLRLVSGLESMIVGEDQILGQVRDSYNLAYASNAVGPFFKNIFTKAINVGKRVRTETEINKGAVSIGSAAVELAEGQLSTLTGKTALLIGAGDMGILVAKSLEGRELEGIFVANRTYERGLALAEELGGRVLRFEEIQAGMRGADLVITASKAPHALITRERVQEALQGRTRGELVIVDVGIPRNVDAEVGSIPGVKLFNIDGLREIAERNRRLREREAAKVMAIIEEETALLLKQIYHIDVEEIVKTIFEDAEEVRRKEVERALRMLGEVGEKERAVIEDLSKVLVKRSVAPIAGKIRRAAEKGDSTSIKMVERLFLEDK
ncbi:MAG: glutamyl-tRNA reductase [Candidatus Hydrothermarchaeota archaeon]